MTVFPEPDFPTQFRALGLVKGSYSPTEEFKGVLTLENGMEVNATLNKYLKTRISNRPSWRLERKGSCPLLENLSENRSNGKIVQCAIKKFSHRRI